jgi:hypothetical protein
MWRIFTATPANGCGFQSATEEERRTYLDMASDGEMRVWWRREQVVGRKETLSGRVWRLLVEWLDGWAACSRRGAAQLGKRSSGALQLCVFVG